MNLPLVTTNIDSRGIATVTLNNPDKHNAFDDHMIAELTLAFSSVANNNNVRAMLLTSNGKSFSAGADLNWMKRMANYSYDENLLDARALAEMLKTLNFMPKPTIARVQGATYGGAVGLVSCCDMAVASEHANFCLSEVKIGLVPATISPYVIAAIGQRAARRYFNTAEVFNAITAEKLGLVSVVTQAKNIDQKVNDLIKSLLGNSPAAITASKQLIFSVDSKPIDDELIESSCKIIAEIRVSTQGQEGLAAFLEKRPAAYYSKN